LVFQKRREKQLREKDTNERCKDIINIQIITEIYALIIPTWQHSTVQPYFNGSG